MRRSLENLDEFCSVGGFNVNACVIAAVLMMCSSLEILCSPSEMSVINPN